MNLHQNQSMHICTKWQPHAGRRGLRCLSWVGTVRGESQGALEHLGILTAPVLAQSTGVEFPEVTTLWEGDALRSMGAGVRAKKFAFVPVKARAAPMCLASRPGAPHIHTSPQKLHLGALRCSSLFGQLLVVVPQLWPQDLRLGARCGAP